MPAPSVWYIPYQRNPFFTGRVDVLVQLHRVLHTENSAALSHPQGISGLGGIGKTQTALENAYRYHSEYNAVFWVRAALPQQESDFVFFKKYPPLESSLHFQPCRCFTNSLSSKRQVAGIMR